MQSINDDPEYRALKEQVKAKEVKRELWGIAGLGAAVGAFAIFLAAATLGSLVIPGYAVAAFVGLVSTYNVFRADQDVRFDTREMESRREAVNLSRSLGQMRSPEAQVAAAHAMGRHSYDDERKRADGKPWVEAMADTSTGRVLS